MKSSDSPSGEHPDSSERAPHTSELAESDASQDSPGVTAHSESDPSRTDLSSTVISEFQLLRRLGSGGMADVYLAHQISLDRSVAVKVLKPDVAGDRDTIVKRFEREARAAAGISHPNIVQVITTGHEGDLSYIVQEYISGLNLSQWIRKHGCPDCATGIKWMTQVAEAMAAAGESGIVHRDIKPENIMITRNGDAKVTDFGLAQVVAPSTGKKMNLTQVGTTMGTPWYMSPEQIQGEPLDHRSDQYSLGITAYHMFAGQPPFPGKNAVTVAVQHLKEEPEPLGNIRADLPSALCSVIGRMMQKQAADRFQTTAELIEALRSLSATSSTPDVVRRPSTGILRQIASEARWMVPICLVLLFAVIWSGRRLYRTHRLPTPQEVGTPVQTSAPRQFAQALLTPDNPNAWQAVIANFPDSPEADMAMLRLALSWLTQPTPDYNAALTAFDRAARAGTDVPEKRYLRVLGLIGKAYTYELRAQSVEATPDDRNLSSDAWLESQQYPDLGGLQPISQEERLAAIEAGPDELRGFAKGNRADDSLSTGNM
ncbi:MAG: protein kinase [Planctomycetaceae bacterium]|nr:protein kinase [Planctomycetaceae bacterium]